MTTAQKRDKMKRRNKTPILINNSLRQAAFATFYADPESDTFANAYQSAIKAGFSDDYSMKITMQPWFKVLSENVGNSMISQAERNLTRTLLLPEKVQAMGAFGPLFQKIEKKIKTKTRDGKIRTKIKTINGNPVMVYSGTLLKYRLDASKFIAERLNKRRYGKDSDTTIVPIQVNINSDREAFA